MEIAQGGVVRAVDHRERQIHEAPPLARAAAQQHEIGRAEGHRRIAPDEIDKPGRLLAVDFDRAPAGSGVDLQTGNALRIRLHFIAERVFSGALAWQRGQGLRPERAQRGGQAERFEQIRLPLPVRAEEEGALRRERQLGELDVAEVLQA